mgnify:CR=1 FL=1
MSRYRIVATGGGIAGASILYHPAEQGWSGNCLTGRKVLAKALAGRAMAGKRSERPVNAVGGERAACVIAAPRRVPEGKAICA